MMAQSKVTEFYQSKKKSVESQAFKKVRLDVPNRSKFELDLCITRDCNPEELSASIFPKAGLGHNQLISPLEGFNLVGAISTKKAITRKTPKSSKSDVNNVRNNSARPKRRKFVQGDLKAGEKTITQFLVKSSSNDIATATTPSVRRNLTEAIDKEAESSRATAAPFRSPTKLDDDLDKGSLILKAIDFKAGNCLIEASPVKTIASESVLNKELIPEPIKPKMKKKSLSELKKQLKSCGKLADLQQCLAKINDSSNKVKSYQEQRQQFMEKLSPVKLSPRKQQSPLKQSPVKSSPIKIKTPFKTPVKKNTLISFSDQVTIPAYKRYSNLASAEASTTLSLPYKYKTLSEYFRCMDTVTSILYNRQEICTFEKLRKGVEEMMKRVFDKLKLGQMKTVFPLAYILQLEKGMSSFINNKNKAKLVIAPNFEYTSQPDISNGLSKIKLDTPAKKIPMNPSCLLERRKIFEKNLLDITKKHHEVFLLGLNPPVSVPSEQIRRWHPKFPLDTVPDIPVSHIPEEEESNVASTAQDVLDKVRGIACDRIEKALQKVAQKNKSTTEVAEKPKKTVVTKGALKGISQSLLDKIRAKEAQNMTRDMLRKPESEKKLEMMARLPEFIRILRTYFVAERKAALHIDDAAAKLSESCQSALSQETAIEHIRFMATLLPDWLFLITISKGEFVKIDKSKEFSVLLGNIQNAVKTEKQL